MNNPPPEASPAKQPSHRNYWLIFLSLAIVTVLLYLSFKGLDWDTFWDTLRHGRYEIFLALLPIASLNFFFRALRWRLLVNTGGNVSTATAFWANMTGYLGNAFLPARAGELLRSALLGKKSGAGMSFVLATALTERILDAVTLVLIGSISLLWQGNIPPALAAALQVMLVLSLVGLLLILVAPSQKGLILKITNKLPLPSKWMGKITGIVERFLEGMRSLQNARRLLSFAGMTAIIWLVDGLGSSIGAGIIGQTLSLGQALILLSALGLSSAMPSTPGYVGIYQFVAVVVLMPFGFSRPDAIAFILISQILNYLTVSFWGLIGLWILNRKPGHSRLSGERPHHG